MSNEQRTMQGMSYRQPPTESLSGCKHLRCKAAVVITLGIILVVAFAAALSSALLIVGICVIIVGAALMFMDLVARGLGKEEMRSHTGSGVNRTWNRLHRERRERRERRRRGSARVTYSAGTGSSEPTVDLGGPPAYDTCISVEELMRCPEPSDWTFLPSEPPPIYVPPITDHDIDHSSTHDADQTSANQSELPVYSISRLMSALTFTLPSYEEATSPDTDSTQSATRACEETLSPVGDTTNDSAAISMALPLNESLPITSDISSIYETPLPFSETHTNATELTLNRDITPPRRV